MRRHLRLRFAFQRGFAIMHRYRNAHICPGDDVSSAALFRQTGGINNNEVYGSKFARERHEKDRKVVLKQVCIGIDGTWILGRMIWIQSAKALKQRCVIEQH